MTTSATSASSSKRPATSWGWSGGLPWLSATRRPQPIWEGGLHGRGRHDLGFNRLNWLSGMVQLSCKSRRKPRSGAFLPDLEKMHELCRECEVRLLRLGSQNQAGEPARAGRLSEAEIGLVVEQIKLIGECDTTADPMAGNGTHR